MIALSIVDFTMFEDNDNVINRFKLIEKDTLVNYNDDIELIFIELPKFKKQEKELNNIKDEWIYFIKNAGSLECIPDNFNNYIKDALDTVNEANLTKDELEAQHKRKEFISIQRLAIKKADEDGFNKGMEKGVEQGIEKGIEKGIAKGKLQEKLEIVKNSISQGLNNKTISLITNLSIEQIEELR